MLTIGYKEKQANVKLKNIPTGSFFIGFLTPAGPILLYMCIDSCEVIEMLSETHIPRITDPETVFYGYKEVDVHMEVST